MYKEQIKNILEDLNKNKIDVEKAFEKLKILPYEDIGFAKIDHHRDIRRGFPEFVLCQNKKTEQIVEIIKRIFKYNDVLATKANEKTFRAVKKIYKNALYNKTAKTIIIKKRKRSMKTQEKVIILSAGTSDIGVSEEAAITAEFLGCNVKRIYDVGVAGVHRLLSKSKEINDSDIIIVVAGMEGALASVVSGMVDKPVIAVPTSIGYGANFKGIAPLLSMMNCCSPGVVVVNIDNGFGAGYFAAMLSINK